MAFYRLTGRKLALPIGYFSWTSLTPSPDSRLIYVSTTGSDSNDGLSAATPKQSPAAGYDLLRNNMPDWLQFKCGDYWPTSRIKDLWPLSGRSASEPMVVTSYGTGPRPRFTLGGSPILQANTSVGGWHPRYLRFVGLEALSGAATTEAGFHWVGQSTDVLFEDCKASGYGRGIQFTGSGSLRHTNSRIRACVFANNFTIGEDASGGLIGEIDGLLIEQCYLLRNGFQDPAEYSQFRHNIYVNNYCTDVDFLDNISVGCDGAMVRSGTRVLRNVGSHWNFGLTVGPGYDVEPAGISPIVEDNIYVEGRDDTDGVTIHKSAGIAYQIGNWVGGRFRRNIGANCTGTDPRFIWAHESETGPIPEERVPTGIGLFGVDLADNISHNHGGHFLMLQNGSIPGLYVSNSCSGNVHQNPGNTRLQDGGVVVMGAAELLAANVAFNGNHLLQAAGANSARFGYVNGSYYTFPNWRTHVGDVGSDQTLQTYPNPGGARLGAYHALHWGEDDYLLLVARMEQQSRNNWDTRLAVPSIRSYLAGCFGR